MEIHHEAKHPKLPFEAEKCARACASPRAALTRACRRRCENVHAVTGGITTQGVAVRGSVKKIVH